MADTILITGAGGKTGRAIIARLAQSGVAVRAFVRHETQAAELQKLGASETVLGDFLRPGDMARAAAGADLVYHIPPNMQPAEVEIGENVIRAAADAGVRRFVYHSVLHPQTQKMPHHWNKLLVEEKLFESGLSYTILQPTVYMQNILAGWRSITGEGKYRVPYPAETRLSLVDLLDVAEAATTALLSESFTAGVFELVGTTPLTQVQVAEIAGTVLGRAVQFEMIPLEEWEREARSGGSLEDYALKTLLAMFHYYAAHGLEGNPFTLTKILGRDPGSLDAFFERQPL